MIGAMRTTIGAIAVCALAGCAGFTEAGRGMLGTSTKALENGLPQAITATIPQDKSSCFARSEALLKDMGAYIYRKDPESAMIAAYVSETDTTPVGVFFTMLDGNRTDVQVTSPSSAAKQAIAEKLFEGLQQEGAGGEGAKGAQSQLEIK